MSIVSGGWAEPRPLHEVMEKFNERLRRENSEPFTPHVFYVSQEALPKWRKILGMNEPQEQEEPK